MSDTEHEYEYSNYGTEKEPRFGEVSYMVAGGGMMNGNAYATIELKKGIYYYCEYGKNASRQAVGNKIVWSDEIYDKKNPYECRSFDILDEEQKVVMCDVKKGCRNTADFEFMTMGLDLKMINKKGCNKCIKKMRKNFPVMIDATGDEVVVKRNK